MKTEKFNSMKMQALYNGLFAAKTNTAAKKQVNTLNTINKVESINVESIVTLTLKEYKPILAQLPRECRGNAMKSFCNAVRRVLGDYGTAFCIDNYGNVISQRIVSRFTAKYESDLLAILLNLLQDSAAEADKKAAEAEIEAKTIAYNEAAYSTLLEMLSEYKAA